MTLREQASALLTTYYGGLATAQILDKLQPLFDQMAREKAELRIMQNAARTIAHYADQRVSDAAAHEPAARVAISTLDSEREMNALLTDEIDDLRAQLTQAEAMMKLADSHCAKYGYIDWPTLRAALDRG